MLVRWSAESYTGNKVVLTSTFDYQVLFLTTHTHTHSLSLSLSLRHSTFIYLSIYVQTSPTFIYNKSIKVWSILCLYTRTTVMSVRLRLFLFPPTGWQQEKMNVWWWAKKFISWKVHMKTSYLLLMTCSPMRPKCYILTSDPAKHAIPKTVEVAYSIGVGELGWQ